MVSGLDLGVNAGSADYQFYLPDLPFGGEGRRQLSNVG